jgi:hypothetical protein
MIKPTRTVNGEDGTSRCTWIDTTSTVTTWYNTSVFVVTTFLQADILLLANMLHNTTV